MVKPFYSVKPEDLGRLGPREAVETLAQLLWSEATADGIAKSLVDVPHAITVRDGGVDAEIAGVTSSSSQGVIKPGITCYQVKAGDVSPTAPSDIKKVLCKSNAAELNDRVKACLDAGGTLVAVLFGTDVPDRKENEAVRAYQSILAEIDAKYATAKVEVWRQNKISAFLERFPSVCLELKGLGRDHLLTHKGWSGNAEMRKPFKVGPMQETFLNEVRAELRQPDRAVHVRVHGPPGVGKTRLTLEATDADDLRPLVAYFDSGRQAIESQLLYELARQDNAAAAVLVVDECDGETRARLWDRLQHSGQRVKLLTIYNESERVSGTTAYKPAPPLEEEQVGAILSEYGVPSHDAGRWIRFCEGSPRAAHIIGKGLRDHPDDILKDPDTVNAWDRYIAGAIGSTDFDQNKCVLRHMALFKKFGWDRDFIAEAKSVAKKVEQANGDITWARFAEVVKNLREKKVLQGETTLYITPQLLQVKLWVEWWETYGPTFVLEEFVQDLPPALRDGFFQMFEYARESRLADGIVKELLAERGPFRRSPLIETDVGARFFLALAKANPEAALAFLTNHLGARTHDELLQFKTGRRETVEALRSMAMERTLFPEAARLLLSLGDAENEGWANNASGTFAGLFTIAPHPKLSSTGATPSERMTILREALESGVPGKRRLALQACNSALEVHHFTRDVGPEYRGIRPEPELWAPKTGAEWKAAVEAVWDLLRTAMERLPPEEKREAAKVFTGRARGVVSRFPGLTAKTVATLSELSKEDTESKKKVLDAILHVLHFEGKEMAPENKELWSSAKDKLTGSDFPSLMRRYVGMQAFTDHFDEMGNHVNQAEPKIRELAAQAARNPAMLEPELQWLVTREAENGYRFGYELALNESGFESLPRIVGAQSRAEPNTSLACLGGYLRRVFEASPEKWEAILDNLAQDEKKAAWVGELTCSSGFSDRAAARLVKLAESGRMTIAQFKGVNARLVGEESLHEIVGHLMRVGSTDAVSIAIDVIHRFCTHAEPKRVPPRALTFAALTHPSILNPGDDYRHDTMADYYWADLANMFLDAYPDQVVMVGKRLVDAFGSKGSVMEGYHASSHEVLARALAAHSEELWKAIAERLDARDRRSFWLSRWLRDGKRPDGGEGLLDIVPAELIWKWADENASTRAALLATCVHPVLSRNGGAPSLARNLLARYGHMPEVRRSFTSNYGTGSFSGSVAKHYQEKSEQLRLFREKEDDPNVLKWVDEQLFKLENEIRGGKAWDERLG